MTIWKYHASSQGITIWMSRRCRDHRIHSQMVSSWVPTRSWWLYPLSLQGVIILGSYLETRTWISTPTTTLWKFAWNSDRWKKLLYCIGWLLALWTWFDGLGIFHSWWNIDHIAFVSVSLRWLWSSSSRGWKWCFVFAMCIRLIGCFWSKESKNSESKELSISFTEKLNNNNVDVFQEQQVRNRSLQYRQ